MVFGNRLRSGLIDARCGAALTIRLKAAFGKDRTTNVKEGLSVYESGRKQQELQEM